MSKHTPGPWTTDDIDQSDFYRYVVGENKIVCRVRLKGFMGNKREHAEADARLIASAPELLEELQNIANADPRNWNEEMRDQFQQWAQSRARAAIAKAECE